MTVEQLMQKHNAYRQWQASEPEWTESDLMLLIKYMAEGYIKYNHDMVIVEVK